MKPKLSEHATRLAQIKRGLDQISDGFYGQLPTTDDSELKSLFESFNTALKAVSNREGLLRDQNVQLAAAVSRIEKLLDASIDGIAFIGDDNSFQFVNRRFSEILGLSRGCLNKKTIAEAEELWKNTIVAPAKLIRVLTPLPHDDRDGREDVVDDVIEIGGAELRFAQVYGAPVYDDDGVFAGRIISLHDNTREMELDRLKTEFISVVSHELRTPLTSIKGYTDLMLSGATGDINDIQREFLGILQSSANRLGNLINDILDLSRIDAGRMEVKHVLVDYIKIVGDLLRLMKAHADEKDISLDVSYPQDVPLVLGDPDRITQVLTNLISNAIKYTPEGGWVKLSIEVTGEATIRTCIADSGIGISNSDQKRLFQKFFRADNSLTRQAGGTGLGLVIVKSIIEMLGGSIWVQSEVGRGSKFFFTLPLAVGRKLAEYADEKSMSFTESGIPDRGLALVQVIDNSSFVRETVQHALFRRGYGVISSSTGEEGLQRARQHKPDVILLDVMMDNCEGFQTLHALKSDPATTLIPVIAFSMHGESGETVALGAISYTDDLLTQTQLVEQLLNKSPSNQREPCVLIVTFNPEQVKEASVAEKKFKTAGISTKVVLGAAEAINSIVIKPPDAVVIDAVGVKEEFVYSLLTTIKSEDDFARIPIVLTGHMFESDGVHFHIGESAAEGRTSIDYVAERVAVVLGTKSYKSDGGNSDDAAMESGILNDK